ncbi:hypothetical protein E2P81_ATG09466 [Venturia nashicola]|uniref:Uncharacterized protein n=1 Tax=Venturia nashicola TaxID=86259 RepID=A0A4Z1P762_9PEZI|nr:hypothetical protein E6O75_ATG09674 [Venturia nashicola]TLD25809.1 hypothetical protein E2P81_ATG09466 [Venturia nashicola]
MSLQLRKQSEMDAPGLLVAGWSKSFSDDVDVVSALDPRRAAEALQTRSRGVDNHGAEPVVCQGQSFFRDKAILESSDMPACEWSTQDLHRHYLVLPGWSEASEPWL